MGKKVYVSISAQYYDHLPVVVAAILDEHPTASIQWFVPNMSQYITQKKAKFDICDLFVMYVPKHGIIGKGAYTELMEAGTKSIPTALVTHNLEYHHKGDFEAEILDYGENWREYAYIRMVGQGVAKDIWDRMWIFFK